VAFAQGSSIAAGRWRRVVVLTGAGASVASGLRPYRGPGGLWEEDPALKAMATAGASPADLWRLWGALRGEVALASPNEAHRALARFEARITGDGGVFSLITQNVDGLHQRAGSRAVIELHGALRRSRCSACDLPPFDDETPHLTPPPCPRCGAPLRPAVVLFDEPLGADEEVGAKRALRGCDLFLAIGTSGSVWPASSFVRSAAYEGARTAYVNLTPLTPPAPDFDEVHLGRAESLLPALLGVLTPRRADLSGAPRPRFPPPLFAHEEAPPGAPSRTLR